MAGKESQPTITSLAAKISEITSDITKYLEENKLQAPTLSADSPTHFPTLSPDLFYQRQVLIDALNDLFVLLSGPSESVFNYVHTVIPDASALNVLNYFDFWSAVPLSGSASYAEIADRVQLPEEVVTRILRHATTIGLFSETAPGKLDTKIQHSSRSAAVAKNAGLRSLVQSILDDAGPPTLVLNEALQKYNRGKKELTKKQEETAFALLHSGGAYSGHKQYFEYLESGDGWRSRNYAGFMRYLKEIFDLGGVVLQLYDWASAGKATVVDVGGSAGHDAVVLAEKFPDLSIIVQDLPQVRPEFDSSVPDELKSRVSYSEHNFFQPQPVKDADIYMLKMILHDYTDGDIIKIFHNLIPALKPGARVILLEYIGDHGETDTPLPRSMRQWGTAPDLRLMALFNSTEKKAGDWKRLLEEADKRFQVAELRTDSHKNFYIIEAVWMG